MTDQAPVDGPGQETAQDRAERLAAAAAELVSELAEFTNDAGDQFVTLARRAQVNRRMIWALGAIVFLGGCISAVLGIVADQTSSLTHRLDVAQTVTRRDTLCPLYGLFLASENPRARAAYPQGPEAYDKAFSVIRQGYAALDCAQFAASALPAQTSGRGASGATVR